MTVDYASARADAGAGIAEGGTAATLLRPGASTGPAYAPTIGGDTEYACTVLLLDYSQRERDGTLVQARDRKVMLSADGLAIVPDVSDRIRIGGEAYQIVNIMPFAPGGVTVFYDMQVRK